MAENATYTYIGAFVDELVRSGVRHLCLCPGSRSTPLAISAARHPGLKVWVLIDERSAAFFALGLGKALRTPAAVLSTSGTAAANFLPAVVEARYGRVPLIVLTADRPHELRDSGAPQTIDQVRLYGTHAKWFVDVGLPEATTGQLRYIRTLAAQAWATARDVPAGPVHLNFPMREPLVPVAAPDELPPAENRAASAWEGRGASRPYAAAHGSLLAPPADLVSGLAREFSGQQRGLIVCGPGDDPALPAAVGRLAAALGYPVLADPLSQVRCGPHDRRYVIDCYDPLLRIDELAASLAPDVILRLGGVPASKPLNQYLALHAGAHHIAVDPGGGWLDPARLASTFIRADPALLCDAVAKTLDGKAPPAIAWAALWRRLASNARTAIQERLHQTHEPFEGRVFAELSEILPDGSSVYVGNSMPVRDLDSFFAGSGRAIRFLGNRGASGIDGLVSSALGAAAAGIGPLVLVLGDLAFYHDMNGLLAAKLHALKATIVLVNNDGGGIFSFLAQADYPEHFETLFGTPHGLEFRHAAQMYGAAYAHAATWEAFRAHMQESLAAADPQRGGVSIVEVRTNRDRNVALHKEIWTAVEAALRPELPLAAPGRSS
jgi:2-succinyl-5-enolpyruvyl-6-hydroxy-3-cyclohexene-1-carboxylate synthase